MCACMAAWTWLHLTSNPTEASVTASCSSDSKALHTRDITVMAADLLALECVCRHLDFGAFCNLVIVHPALLLKFRKERRGLLIVARLVRFRLHKRLLEAQAVIAAQAYLTRKTWALAPEAAPAFFNPRIGCTDTHHVRFFDRCVLTRHSPSLTGRRPCRTWVWSADPWPT